MLNIYIYIFVYLRHRSHSTFDLGSSFCSYKKSSFFSVIFLFIFLVILFPKLGDVCLVFGPQNSHLCLFLLLPKVCIQLEDGTGIGLPLVAFPNSVLVDFYDWLKWASNGPRTSSHLLPFLLQTFFRPYFQVLFVFLILNETCCSCLLYE